MTHATPTFRSVQQRRVSEHRDHADSFRFFNLLTSDLLLETTEASLPEHRERLFPPTETLSMFLAQVMSADRSCQQAVNRAAVTRVISCLPTCSTHTGGYCRARQRLPLELVAELTRHVGEATSAEVPEAWHWQGRRVLLVDGTTMTMPDTAANQMVYPQQGGQLPGLGFPICRLVGITSLASGSLLNAAIGPFKGKGSDEQTLLRHLQDSLQPGDILLGDAYFATYFFLATMVARGVDVLMEQYGARRRSTDFRQGQRIGPRDHWITITKPGTKPDWMSEEEYRLAPNTITVRELRAGGKTLVTTLAPDTAGKNELHSLYQTRWQVELDIRHIKDTLGMNILSCKTPDMVNKEIWVYLLAYNLIRLLMAQSALLADLMPRMLSFKHCLQLWTNWTQQLGSVELYPPLFELMAEQRVGCRPGRIEPRAVKRRPKPYALLTKPRPQARQHVLDFGHPQKVK